ncbi:hypothetical protein AB0J63_28720 [Streptosporangium canum]|uniref:hypothetical protein n=1 Tax=Streptosporangium canum TaxID=324952 RepID=UPI003423F725
MTPLERRYRRLLRAYPHDYRSAYGDELLDVLLESASPLRTVPEPREAAGLVIGGLRERLTRAGRGSSWANGVHLGVTALCVAQLAALLPYAPAIPLWTLLSALALLAVLRGRVRLALPLVLLTGAKAVAVASGEPLFDHLLLPVEPGFLTDAPLFALSEPPPVATDYALALGGLLVLAVYGRPLTPRSWWWWAAVPPMAWAGPAWMESGTVYPISLSRMAVELALLGMALWAGRLSHDPRWALGATIYVTVASARLWDHAADLTRQHLAYWGLLVFLAGATALVPFGHWRRASTPRLD